MTDDPVPRPLVVPGEHFRPMAERLGKRMDEVPVEAGEVSDIFGLVDEHLERLDGHVVAFGERIGEGLGRLTHEPDECFHEMASCLNADLEGILDGYDDVRRLKPHEEDFEGWVLLVEIYEETLFQIQFWLEAVVEFLDDPLARVKKRGIPADGNGAVNLHLEMQSPRQVRLLTRWLQSRGRDLRVAQEKAWAQEDRRRAHRAGLIVGSPIGWWTGKGQSGLGWSPRMRCQSTGRANSCTMKRPVSRAEHEADAVAGRCARGRIGAAQRVACVAPAARGNGIRSGLAGVRRRSPAGYWESRNATRNDAR